MPPPNKYNLYLFGGAKQNIYLWYDISAKNKNKIMPTFVITLDFDILIRITVALIVLGYIAYSGWGKS